MTIIKTFDTEENQKKFPRKYMVLAAVCLFALVLVEIWASNTVIAYGEKYEKLSVMERNLKMENQILQNEIARNSSLNVIATRSSELGFLSPASIEYIR